MLWGVSESNPSTKRLGLLALTALGVVYGDIGTSPLYAFRECFEGGGVAVTRAGVVGVLSAIVWSLVVVVSVKYLAWVLRADNRGEGGVLALMTLVTAALPRNGRGRGAWVAVGLFGACLLYGDGMITPAISVLSAIEGIEVATPALSPFVIPASILVLVGLFAVQHRGTHSIGSVFGPIMLVWFVCLAALGLPWIVRVPQVLGALSPFEALAFAGAHGTAALAVLGGVFLVVTGGEALYADMGHFGRRPIRWSWFAFVLPALLVHYLGQGALLLSHPEAVENPFYRMAPDWARWPLVLLATVATVIASQAVISGAFSLTRQAVQLGYLPRLEIRHTSAAQAGQIYVPFVNWVLLLATVGLVLGFGSSSALAGAYGVAVVTTMVITTLSAYACSRLVWGWRRLPALSLSLAFLLVDGVFFSANVLKIPEGGWVPLLVAAGVYFLMATWRRGREHLRRRLLERRVGVRAFLEDLGSHAVPRVPGTAVFLDSNPDGVPHTLLHNLEHNKVLHERVVLLTVVVREVPRVEAYERIEVVELASGFFRVLAFAGFMEDVHVPTLLREARKEGLAYDGVRASTFFLGRETLVRGTHHAMPWWREALFAFLSRNQRPADLYFGIPPNRVLEVGLQLPV